MQNIATTEKISAQMRAYAAWLKDRGQVWLLTREKTTSSEFFEDEVVETASSSLLATTIAADIPEKLQEPDKRSCQVLFVTDFPDQVTSDEDAHLFTDEEAALLNRIIAALALDPERICCRALWKVASGDLRGRRLSEFTKSGAKQLEGLIQELHPETVVILGALAATAVHGEKARFSAVRGHLAKPLGGQQCSMLTTFHPRDLLRFKPNKELAWRDLKQIALK